MKYEYGSIQHPFWHRVKKPLLRFLGFLLVMICLAVIVGSAGYFYVSHKYLSNAPKLDSKLETTAPARLEYLDNDGEVFYPLTKPTFYQTAKSDLSKNYQDALLSIEDRDFYQEKGVNFLRMGKVMLYDLHVKSASQLQGGSTLSQQLIKLTYFSTSAKQRTVKRKVQEIYLAQKLDRKFSKKDILRMYSNKVYLGNGITGMNSAAHFYYGKSLAELSKDQCAVLTGMVQAPSAYEPYHHPESCLKRRNQVIRAMYANQKISRRQEKRLLKEPLKHGLVSIKDHQKLFKQAQEQELTYDAFLSTTDSQLRAYPKLLKRDFNGTVKIDTSLDRKLQLELNSIVKHQAYPNKKLQTAVAVLDNQSGDVLAVSGGRNIEQAQGFNRAQNLNRSTGSAIKPILDYAPAFDLQNIQQYTAVQDTPYNYPHTHKPVHDFDSRYLGNMTVKSALIQSRNIPAVKMFVQNGLKNEQALGYALGIKQKLYPADAIGVNWSPLQLASAYTALANNGIKSNYKTLDEIRYGKRKIKMQTASVKLYTPQAAFLTTDILRYVFSNQGTAKQAYISKIDQAGKTGTTGYAYGSKHPKDALTDAWMAGFTKRYTVVVWLGYDNPNSKKYYLKQRDVPLSLKIYKQVTKYLDDNRRMTPPSGIRRTGQYYYQGTSSLGDAPFLHQNNVVDSHQAYLPSAKLNSLFEKKKKQHRWLTGF